MKVTITGTSADDDCREVELTIECLGRNDSGWNDWQLIVGKTVFTVSDLEDAIDFLMESENG